MSAAEIRVAVAESADTAPLRRRVLRPNLPTDAAMPGDVPDATHLAAWDGSEVVGSVALLPRAFPLRPDEQPALQLRAMAVTPDRQGTGIGALIMAEVLRVAADRQVRVLWCNARTSAQRFYERAGLHAEGDVFITADTGVEHVVMWRRLA